MSSQVSVHSVEALKDLRVALALYGEDTLAALGAVGAEVRRTVRWLEQDRPAYWQDQIKRRRELVSQAKAELFRRQLQKRPDHTPAMSEQKENLHKAEASLQDAEKRLIMVRKWQPRLQHAVLEYHASVQRLKDLSATDVPSAVDLLSRLIDALEAYLLVQPPSGSGLEPAKTRASAEMESIATKMLDEAPAAATVPNSGEDMAEGEPSRAIREEPDAPDAADERPLSGSID
ncbi:MAG: hypothetical protein ACLQGP_36310 [Isosphaeraceae bacterium]